MPPCERKIISMADLDHSLLTVRGIPSAAISMAGRTVASFPPPSIDSFMVRGLDKAQDFFYKAQSANKGAGHYLATLSKIVEDAGRHLETVVFTARSEKHRDVTEGNLERHHLLQHISELHFCGFHSLYDMTGNFIKAQIELGSSVVVLNDDTRLVTHLAEANPWINEGDPKALFYLVRNFSNRKIRRNPSSDYPNIVIIDDLNHASLDFSRRINSGEF
jgi:hypothetical protein